MPSQQRIPRQLRQVRNTPPANTWRTRISDIVTTRSAPASSLTLIYGFAGLIALGTILLVLPASSRTGQATSVVDALFTATSAVCVTGLVVRDTGSYWSPWGQGVILILIQLGGFGFMTSTTVLFLALRQRIGLRERLLVGETMGMATAGGMVNLVRRLAIFTLLTESTGAIVLFFAFFPRITLKTAIWNAIFHSISAFNNAGFDVLANNFRSLMDYQQNTLLLLTLAVLIFLGGIGFVVLEDINKVRSFSKLHLDSKMVLVTTAVLLVLGTMFILIGEFSNPDTLGVFSLPNKFLLSFFQAVTPRTAGFTAIDMGKVADYTLLFVVFLMFVGGAAGSTAGGVKVGTFGIIIATVISSIRGKENSEAFGREFLPEQVMRALTIIVLALAIGISVALILTFTEHIRFLNLLFESFSALGTIGLTTGITPNLSLAGRIVLIPTMFIGRLGILTLVLSLVKRQQPSTYRYPKDYVRIG